MGKKKIETNSKPGNYREIFEQVDLPLLVVDAQLAILQANRQAVRDYGYSTAELLSLPLRALIAPESQEEFAQVELEAFTALSQRRAWSGELNLLTRDGRRMVVESRWRLITETASRQKYILIANNEITEQKRLEGLLLHSQRLETIGRLASGIAHDLNNVLAPILIALHMLRQRSSDPEVLRWLDLLKNNAEHGSRMVAQVLAFASDREDEKAPLQLKHLIKQTIEVLRHTFPDRIQLKGEIGDDLWLVNGNTTHLYQMLMNLCVNASEAMPQGGQITIKAHNAVLADCLRPLLGACRPGNYVALSVCDTGEGIAEELREKIFAPFFTTKNGAGTGLGLFSVAEIVKGHRGNLELESQPGAGTEFRIYLPASEVNEVGSPAESGQTYSQLRPGQGERVLLIDDDLAVLELTREVLQASGYAVVTAASLREAKEKLLSNGAVSAALMDIFPLAQAEVAELQALAPGAGIILTSGLLRFARPAQSALLGKIFYLPKPYTADKLLRSLAAVLQQR